MWVQFHDMHSGGSLKESPYGYIYIEAPSEEEAEVIFYNRFGHNPSRVTCTCCGDDYSISHHESLAQLSGYERGCRSLATKKNASGRYIPDESDYFRNHYYLEEDEEPAAGYTVDTPRYRRDYVRLDEYVQQKDVLVIHAKDISPGERKGTVPEQGYVWRD